MVKWLKLRYILFSVFNNQGVWSSLLISFLLVSIGSAPLYAQNKLQVEGKVIDAQSHQSLPGVNVVVKGTQTGTSTDPNGKYKLQVNSRRDTLIFSYIGYASKIIPVNGRSSINVSLAPQTIQGQQLVVVGYGVQKKSDLSSSISTVSPSEIQTNSVLPNAAAALEGTTPGVSVTTSSGAPGANINIRIRGSNTFGNNNPLVIVDGSPGSLNDVSPEDIASIQVLKDAAAAAIYGSRAANGVIIVTTKQGQSGKTRVQVRSSYGVQSPVRFLSMANTQQYATIDNRLQESVGQQPMPQLANPGSLPNVDWQRAYYKSAPIFNSYLGISGGQKNSTYNISGTFNNQKGIATETWYRKALLHYNGHQVAGAFKFNETLSWMDENTRYVPGGGDMPVIMTVYSALPFMPIHDKNNDGGFGGAPSWINTQPRNPIGLATLEDNEGHNNNMHFDVNAQYQFLKHLNYKINAGYSVSNDYYPSYTPTYYMSTERQNIRASLNENRSREHHWLIENTLNYNQQFGFHKVNIMVGYTAEEDHYRNTTGYMEGFPNNSLYVLSASTGYSINASGNDYKWAMVSMLGRLMYSYNNKYYLTANIRRDGSSRFGPTNRYGVFPSASVAWRLSSESFFKPLQNYIQNFKIRASYGVLGNQPTNDYAYIPTVTYTPYLGYLIGGSFLTGAAEESFANQNVKWETTKDTDIGVDITFLNNFDFTGDYYFDKTTNVLMNVPIPPSTGTSSNPLVNTGEFQNQGVEFNLTYNSPKSGSGFKYSVTGNFSTIRNKVLKLGYAGQIIYGSGLRYSLPVSVAKVGLPLGAFYLLQADGIFQNQQEIDNWKGKNGQVLQPNAKPGDIRYLDVNGDGVINSSDVAYSGSPFPQFSYGVNFNASYKNFDFTLFLQGTYGNKIYNANLWEGMRGTDQYNFNTRLLDAWTPSNTNTDVPRLTWNDPNHNSYPSTRFLQNGSYLRFKTVQIGYTLPADLLNRVGVSKLRIYVNANNLFTISPYTGYDPSYTGDGLLNRGVDQALYPLARTITAGATLNF